MQETIFLRLWCLWVLFLYFRSKTQKKPLVSKVVLLWRKTLINNDHNQVFWARETEHPQQTIVQNENRWWATWFWSLLSKVFLLWRIIKTTKGPLFPRSPENLSGTENKVVKQLQRFMTCTRRFLWQGMLCHQKYCRTGLFCFCSY